MLNYTHQGIKFKEVELLFASDTEHGFDVDWLPSVVYSIYAGKFSHLKRWGVADTGDVGANPEKKIPINN